MKYRIALTILATIIFALIIGSIAGSQILDVNTATRTAWQIVLSLLLIMLCAFRYKSSERFIIEDTTGKNSKYYRLHRNRIQQQSDQQIDDYTLQATKIFRNSFESDTAVVDLINLLLNTQRWTPRVSETVHIERGYLHIIRTMNVHVNEKTPYALIPVIPVKKHLLIDGLSVKLGESRISTLDTKESTGLLHFAIRPIFFSLFKKNEQSEKDFEYIMRCVSPVAEFDVIRVNEVWDLLEGMCIEQGINQDGYHYKALTTVIQTASANNWIFVPIQNSNFEIETRHEVKEPDVSSAGKPDDNTPTDASLPLANDSPKITTISVSSDTSHQDISELTEVTPGRSKIRLTCEYNVRTRPDEHLPYRTRARNFFGMTNRKYYVPMIGAFTARSYHLTVEAPEDMYVHHAEIVLEPNDPLSETDRKQTKIELGDLPQLQVSESLGLNYCHAYARDFNSATRIAQRGNEGGLQLLKMVSGKPLLEIELRDIPPGISLPILLSSLTLLVMVTLVALNYSQIFGTQLSFVGLVFASPAVLAGWIILRLPEKALKILSFPVLCSCLWFLLNCGLTVVFAGVSPIRSWSTSASFSFIGTSSIPWMLLLLSTSANFFHALIIYIARTMRYNDRVALNYQNVTLAKDKV